jgi:hypothetical protein
MKHISYIAGLAAMALACTGCWPEHITSSPAACGVVLDAKTHAAICGARVGMSRTWDSYWSGLNPPMLEHCITNVREPVVITGTNGAFSIPREHVWVLMYPTPMFHCSGTLVILSDGYKPGLIPMSNIGNMDEKPGTFLLTPVQE